MTNPSATVFVFRHQVPTDFQGRVLSWGIFGAMAMRALMVLAGVEAIENFKAVLLVYVPRRAVMRAMAGFRPQSA